MNEIPMIEPHSQTQHQERRKDARRKIAVAIELCAEGTNVPMRAETADLSLGGCYVEMPFPLEVGITLSTTMWIGKSKLTTKGKVVTRHPQFGNGIQFVDMPPENQGRLESFLRSADQDQRTD